jgi:hypothetical protein
MSQRWLIRKWWRRWLKGSNETYCKTYNTFFTMTLEAALWDIGLTSVGVILGYWVAVGYDRRKTRDDFEKAHNLSMNTLVSSLKTNSKCIDQMFTVELGAGLHPSYPLDTTALALINFGARPFLPKNTDWPDKFNRLRFEMEHINRKLLMDFIGKTIHLIPINTNEIQIAYQRYNATGQTDSPDPNHPWSGTVTLLLRTKKALDEQILELERFGYIGEVIKPY